MRDIEYLFKFIDDARQNILEAIESLNALKDEVKDLSGKVSTVVPSQVDITINALVKVINGSEQNSLDNLENYLDNVPVVELRDKSSIDILNKDKAPSGDVVANENSVSEEPVMNSIAPPIAEAKHRWNPLPELKEDLNDDFLEDQYEDDYSYDLADNFSLEDAPIDDEIDDDDSDWDSIWTSVKDNNYWDSDALINSLPPEDNFGYEEVDDDYDGSPIQEQLENESDKKWNDFRESFKK